MEIKYIEPSVLHDEMLRLRKEKQMDFLECLSGMDWGIPDEKDAPDTPRGLGVVYLLESTITGERIAVRTATLNREHPELPSVSDIWKAADFKERANGAKGFPIIVKKRGNAQFCPKFLTVLADGFKTCNDRQCDLLAETVILALLIPAASALFNPCILKISPLYSTPAFLCSLAAI